MARTIESNEKMKEDRRRRILDGALKLFAVKGLSATKISDIAKESGMSQGLVYHYYKNKGEIFTELISFAFDRMIEAAEGLEQMTTPVAEKIPLAVNGIFDSLEKDEITSLFYLLIANATISEAIPDEAREIIREKNRIPYEIMEGIFDTGIEEGSVREFDPADLAVLFWTTLKGIAIHRATHGRGFTFPDPAIITGMFLKEREL